MFSELIPGVSWSMAMGRRVVEAAAEAEEEEDVLKDPSVA